MAPLTALGGSLLVLGVHKGGSSALFAYLASHPLVDPALCKEPHFWDWRFPELQRGFTSSERVREAVGRDYARHFPPAVAEGRLAAEATPYFAKALSVPPRIRAGGAAVRLVVSLRNPVHRVVSQYVGQAASAPPCIHGGGWRRWCDGGPQDTPRLRRYGSCSAWVQAEVRDLATKCGPHGPGAAGAAHLQCVLRLAEKDNGVAKSIYSPQLAGWLEHFSPNQMYVMQAEQLFAAPEATVGHILQWAGLPPLPKGGVSAIGVVGSRHMERVRAAAAAGGAEAQRFDCNQSALATFFAPYERQLRVLLEAHFQRAHAKWRSWHLS